MKDEEQKEILNLDEAAAYLRVSEETLRGWVGTGELPAARKGDSFRFQTSELKSWAKEQLTIDQAEPIRIKDVLSPERTLILKDPHKRESLQALIDILAETDQVKDPIELKEGIFKREELMSTGIGLGIGVPHVRLASISNLTMAMGVSRAPIRDYISLDGKPVHIVCLLAAGKYQHGEYLKTLAAISARLKRPLFREMILHAPDAAAIYGIMVNQAGSDHA